MNAAACLLAVCVSCLLLPAVAAPPAQPQARDNPALRPIEDTPGLPRVLLIGDSISIDYTIPTRRILEGQANVHRPPVNCGPSSRGAASIDDWLGDGEWDVIHLNFGLHDLVVTDDGQHQVELDAYESNLGAMIDKVAATGAKLIWCTTTPVPNENVTPFRRPADVIAYNEAAARVIEGRDIAVDDLYSFALPELAKIQRPNNVHFTAEGSKILARQVAASIRTALGIEE